MKNHAKEYLEDYKRNKPLWEKKLIDFALLTNGNIKKENIKEIYNLLISKENEIKLEEIKNDFNRDNKNSQIILTKLNHNSGVNALKEKTSIKFSSECNVIFGYNGSGKSSYFKILNEISGGNQKKDILSNIYTKNKSLIDVDLEYKCNNNTYKIKWNNTKRSIEPISKVKVFDSSYLNGFLSERSLDETILQPFGLHLFSYIIEKIDELKTMLKEDIEEKKNSKPKINTENFSKKFKYVFETQEINDFLKLKSSIESLYSFSDIKELDKLIQEKKSFDQTNYNDKIKNLEIKNKVIKDIKNEINSVLNKLKTESGEINSLLEKYHKKNQESLEYKNQIKILEKIPKSDTKEWKDFIFKAKEYSDIIDDKNICPYCHQTLGNNAKELLRAYTIYLENQIENELKEIYGELQKKEELILNIHINPKNIEDIKNIIEDNILYENVIITNKELTSIKKYILENINNKSKKLVINFDTTSELLNNLYFDEKISLYHKQISDFNSDKTVKERIIKEIDKKLIPLMENQSVSQQKKYIEKWLKLEEKIQLYLKKYKSINTKELSSLSKKAHNELITENLSKQFEEELKYLFNYKTFEVRLEKGKTKKGISTTKLVLLKKYPVSNILSEGEQKAVALSLFIAESKIQNIPNPLILDDPVNSLDHKIAANLANRLLNLENQIIVFTHNKLFLDAFESNRNNHICKNYDGGCNKNKGKHIFLYKIDSYSKEEKGIISIMKKDCSKKYLSEAKSKLKDKSFSSIGGLIRRAVETLIDEKIFNGSIPIKFSNKNSRIDWDGLKKLNPDDKLIDKLRKIHDRVSGGDLHRGTELRENPIEKEEYESMIQELEKLSK